MLYKIVGGCALFLTLVAVIIKIVVIVLPNFVDVHVIEDIDDANEDNRIAQVGVYQAIFDTTQDPQRREAARLGIAPLKIESPSTEFALLFPSQENFAATVNPLNRETVELINGLAGNDNADALIPAIDALEGLEFDDCDQYAADFLVTVGTLFATFQLASLPDAIVTVSNLIIQGLQAQAGLANFGAATSELLKSVAGVTVLGTFGVISNTDGNLCNGLSVASLMSDVRAANCNVALAGAVGASSPELGSLVSITFADATRTGCEDTDTLQTCAGTLANEFEFAEGGLDQPVVFNAGQVDFCVNGACPTMLALITAAKNLATGAIAAGSQDPALQLYIDGATIYEGLGAVQPDQSSAADFTLLAVPRAEAVIDNTDTAARAFIQPCAALGTVSGQAVCGTLGQYFAVVNEVLEELNPEIAAQVETIFSLYDTCLNTFMSTAASCPGIGAVGFAQNIFGEEEIGGSTALADLAAECEEDEVDKEKVAESQIYVGLSAGLEILAFLLFAVGILVPLGAGRVIIIIASVFAVSAGIFVFAALTTVASAPVFDNVGEEPEEGFDTVFVAGVVGPLAAAAGGIVIFAGVVGLIAGVLACIAVDTSGDVYEGKGDDVAVADGEDPESKL